MIRTYMKDNDVTAYGLAKIVGMEPKSLYNIMQDKSRMSYATFRLLVDKGAIDHEYAQFIDDDTYLNDKRCNEVIWDLEKAGVPIKSIVMQLYRSVTRLNKNIKK